MRLVVVLGLVGGLLGVGAGGAGGVVGVVDAPAAPRACLDVPERGFVDVADSNVHKDAIDCVAFYGITIGCGSGEGFCPEQRVPRWQVALFLARVAELPGVFLGPGLDDGAGFDDLGEALPADAVAAVNRLSSEGVIKGRSETRFDPYGLITRGQMALLLVRFLKLAPSSGVLVDTDGQVNINGAGPDDFFPDVGPVLPNEFDQATGGLFELGIAKGRTDGDFDPFDGLTRAQMASFLARMLDHIYQLDGGNVPIGGPVGPGPVVPPTTTLPPGPPTTTIPPVATSGRMTNLIMHERQVARVDLVRPESEVFANADRRGYSYQVSSANPDVASVRLDHTVAEVTAVSPGRTKITVTASLGDDSLSNEFTVAVQKGIDYDRDGDGLLEIWNLRQLNGIRMDLNGDGNADSDSNKATYDGLFTDAVDRKGCPATGCVGFELAADLDFDTNGNGEADENDAYSGGAGWSPIGPFKAVFEGNAHTISNLFLNVPETAAAHQDWGLFGKVESAGELRGVRLVGASVTTNRSDSDVGMLAGELNGTVRRSSASGSFRGSRPGNTQVGGLVGRVSQVGNVEPLLTDSYASIDVDRRGVLGGLVGRLEAGVIQRSYAVGSLHNPSSQNADSSAGGLVGHVTGGEMKQVYSAVDLSVTPANADAEMGGLVGTFGIVGSSSGGSGGEAFVAGRLLGGSTNDRFSNMYGGIAGATYSGDLEETGVYWDSDVTGRNDAGQDTNGTGLTTAEMRADTQAEVNDAGYEGVYKDWDKSTWDFGTSAQYPALMVDFDNDGVATWQEFGDQRGANTVRELRDAPDVTLNQRQELLVGPGVFGAFNGEGLTFSGSSDDTTKVTASAGAHGVVLTGVAAGETQVTISATDAGGGSQQQTFKVTVTALLDHDVDDDGLIEVANLAQLDAIRWDPDGNGTVGSADQSSYTTAFASPTSGMGCPASGCTGYELVADLDFDTNGDGSVGQGDTYWRLGAGWAPLGTFTATFDGNGHTIDGLVVKPLSSDTGTRWGLFSSLSNTSVVRGVSLTGVDVHVVQASARVGALAGVSSGLVQRSSSAGEIVTSAGGAVYSGGLLGEVLKVGSVIPEVADSYSEANVTSSGGRAGGLAGHGDGGRIVRSYATGNVLTSASGTTGSVNHGGLLGYSRAAVVDQVYASGAVSVPNTTAGHGAGLIGRASIATVGESLAVGAVGAAGTTEPAGALGGLVASASGLVTADSGSYWSVTTLGQTSSIGGGTSKTTTELRADSNADVAGPYYGGIYRTWDSDVWDFGTGSQYPVLVVDFNNDGVATWQEFGNQRRAGTPAVYGAFADQSLDMNEVVELSAAGVFHDPDGDAMDFTTSVTGEAAEAAVEGAVIRVTAKAPGTATVTVTAQGTSGSAVSDSFTVTVSSVNDYDADGDGLIEVRNFDQLAAVGLDPDGDGTVDSGVQTNYNDAFPNPATGMGCPTAGCDGYELVADLDFDRNGNGEPDSDDWFWNGGEGWAPIDEYAAVFEGNGHTISNLYINVLTGSDGDFGLFGKVLSTGELRGVRLVDASVTVSRPRVGVGLLAGELSGVVRRSSATGSVSGALSSASVGGLVGYMNKDGSVVPLVADSWVSIEGTGGNQLGGIAGQILVGGVIERSYAMGSLHTTVSTPGGPDVGGLVGLASTGAVLRQVYAAVDMSIKPDAATGKVGGLVGQFVGGSAGEAFVAGRVLGNSADTSTSSVFGGLVGVTNSGGVAATGVYWDTHVTGQTVAGVDSGGNPTTNGTGLPTSRLRADTNTLVADVSYDGVFKDWDPAAWDFGTASQYPALVADFDGDGVATWEEFGNQRADRSVRKLKDATALTLHQREQVLLGQDLFNAYNGAGMTFRGSSSNNSTVAVQSLSAGVLFTALRQGSANITVTAVSSTGARQSQTFTVTVTESVAYDTDGDNLVEISNLAQLNAVRHDLDGNGSVSNTNESAFAAAFPNRATNMGCRPSCQGYELAADLDFDTNNNDQIDSGDTYWNNGAGWQPLGTYDATFDGNGHTISNLHIDSTATAGDFGLFSVLDDDAVVRSLGLVDASVRLTSTSTTAQSVGIVAGQNRGRVRDVHSTGTVTGAGANIVAGGLVGFNNGAGLTKAPSVELSYSTAGVTAGKHAGGLIGSHYQAQVTRSYAAGPVTGTGSGPTDIGGLVGFADAASGETATITDSYATGAVTGQNVTNVYVGGLVGRTDRATISAAYATGAVTAARADTTVGGLIATTTANTTVSPNAHWNTITTRVAATTGAAGSPKTSRELATETNAIKALNDYGGIHEDWDHLAWDYGNALQYPVLLTDLNRDGTSTWQEFGQQRPAATLVVNPIPKTYMLPARDLTIPLEGATVVFAKPNVEPLTYTVASSTPSVATVSVDDSGASFTITGLIHGASLITVNATDSGGRTASTIFALRVRDLVDYDGIGNGQLELGNIAQLDAIRHDFDGNGVPTSDGQSTFDSAFQLAEPNLGCPPKGCYGGHELIADLNFDSNGDNKVDATDHDGRWWRDGKGWEPIGEGADWYRTTLEGNGHKISRLTMNDTIGPWVGDMGLFTIVHTHATIRNLGLENVNISGRPTTGRTNAYIGALAGRLIDGSVDGVYVTGLVQGFGRTGDRFNNTVVGGLLGTQHLLHGRSRVHRSFTLVDIHSSNSDGVGGIVSQVSGSDLKSSYSRANVVGRNNELTGGIAGSVYRYGTQSSVVEDLYFAGTVSHRSGGNTREVTGFAHTDNAGPAQFADSYWDSETSATTSGNVAEHKTTSELQTDTNETVAANDYTGIFQNWDASEWDFGTSSEYPVLSIDFDRDGVATWQEFGDQRQAKRPAVVNPIPDMTLAVAEQSQVELLGSGVRVFSDWTGDGYTYSATSRPSGVATLSLDSDTRVLTVRGVRAGTTTVTVTATNSAGLSQEHSFNVTVTQP